MSDNDASIRAVRVSKWYGKVTALQDVSLHLEPGVWGLLGPNGSGKTTFLRIAGGQLKPSIGEIKVCGMAPFGNVDALRRIGLCPEADALYDELTGLEFVTAMAELSGVPRKEARDRAAGALEAFGLEKAMERRMGGYSRGMRQRAKLAQSIVHDPDVLLLDEPLTGTDPTSRAVILDEIRRRAKEGAVVLFSTHVLHEVEALTDRVLLIARGQVVAQGRVHEIRDLLEEHPHHVRVECDRPRAFAAVVLAQPGILGLRFVGDGAVEFETREPDSTYAAIAKEAVAGKFNVLSLTSPDATLEALFHYLVERSGRMAGTGADAAVGSATAQPYTGKMKAGESAKGTKKDKATKKAAAKPTETPTATGTATETAPAPATAPATETATAPASATETATETVTETATAPASATETETATAPVTATAPATATAPVTETVTATETATDSGTKGASS